MKGGGGIKLTPSQKKTILKMPILITVKPLNSKRHLYFYLTRPVTDCLIHSIHSRYDSLNPKRIVLLIESKDIFATMLVQMCFQLFNLFNLKKSCRGLFDGQICWTDVWQFFLLKAQQVPNFYHKVLKNWMLNVNYY